MNQEVERFDWNSTALTVENCKDILGDQLMRVLVLPTIDDFLPLLAEVGFPDYLIQHPEVWKSVFAEFTPLYEKAIDEMDEWSQDIESKYRLRLVKLYYSNPALSQSELREHLIIFDKGWDLIKFHVHLKAWQDVLKMLAVKAGEQVARELEQWIYYHYFSDKFNDATHQWWVALVQTKNVPIFIDESMLERIEELNTGDASMRLSIELDRLYARYYNECLQSNSDAVGLYFISDGTNSHRPPFVANYYLLKEAWIKNKVMSILQDFARCLTPEEVQIVVEWATDFIGTKFEGEEHELCGDELITTKTLFADLPSVLDLDIFSN
jgi:hypothetical protein